MENDRISHYKRSLAVLLKDRSIPRLPITLQNEEDIYCRLTALYALEVEQRGKVFNYDDHTKNRLERITRWLIHSSSRGLILMGTLGNGKTTMLRAIHDLFMGYSTMRDAQTVYNYFKEENQLLSKNDKLLLLDDLGVEPLRCRIFGEEHHPLSQLLLSRYDLQRTTIIATNLSYDEIQNRYGDRVVDRMCETYEFIRYDTESYRRMH